MQVEENADVEVSVERKLERSTSTDALSELRTASLSGEEYQGPHDWRRRLRRVDSPIHGVENENVEKQFVSK